VAGCCEHGDEHLGSIKVEFLDYLSDTKDSSPWG
jgi:hypothetical protein